MKTKQVIGTVDRSGVCQKSDNEIIYGCLMGRARTLERVIERKKAFLSPNERKELQDEYERTFGLTERFRRGQP